MLRRSFKRGDTLIEVLFAVSVFSLVAVGSLSVMNQGTSSSQRSLETTLVRQQVDTQAETLRFMHDAYVNAYQSGGVYDALTPAGQWKRLADAVGTAPIAAVEVSTAGCPAIPAGAFVVDPKTATFNNVAATIKPAQTYAQLVYDPSGTTLTAQGIWIQGVRHTAADANSNGYIDFSIRTCWDAPGLNVPMTIETIVRLYEPKA